MLSLAESIQGFNASICLHISVPGNGSYFFKSWAPLFAVFCHVLKKSSWFSTLPPVQALAKTSLDGPGSHKLFFCLDRADTSETSVWHRPRSN
jgi:hypothetical protein